MMTQESIGEKVNCPVCSTQCEALVQYCEQCGWHFELFLSQPDQQQQNAYQQRLDRHRTLWERSNNEPKKTVRNVPSPLSDHRLNIGSPNAEQIEKSELEKNITESDVSQSTEQSNDQTYSDLSTHTKVIATICLLCLGGGIAMFLLKDDKSASNTPEQESNISTIDTNKNMAKSVHKDTDKDGHADVNDKCPNEPEDFDEYQDSDGCPDPDNDNDGILDKDDKCPLKKEDKDGFKDKDGCPDPDNDGDKILDKDDKCPNVPGLSKEQGCPMIDSDRDGISDDKDKCPKKPEDKDGFEDKDGCPDPDNDGDKILDVNDKCPMIAGLKKDWGCSFKISKNLRRKYPKLIKMILATESMDNEERQYWFDLMPVMTKEQLKNLFDILDNEQKKLKEIDNFYNRTSKEIERDEALIKAGKKKAPWSAD